MGRGVLMTADYGALPAAARLALPLRTVPQLPFNHPPALLNPVRGSFHGHPKNFYKHSELPSLKQSYLENWRNYKRAPTGPE